MALLITNVRFDNGKHRHGAEKDEQDMSKLLISLGYNVEQHRDLSGVVRWASHMRYHVICGPAMSVSLTESCSHTGDRRGDRQIF